MSLDVLNSGSGASLVEQDLKFKTNFLGKKNHLHFMHFLVRTLHLKKNTHENTKNTPSKVAHNQHSIANRPKTSPNLNFCSIKITHRMTYV